MRVVANVEPAVTCTLTLVGRIPVLVRAFGKHPNIASGSWAPMAGRTYKTHERGGLFEVFEPMTWNRFRVMHWPRRLGARSRLFNVASPENELSVIS